MTTNKYLYRSIPLFLLCASVLFGADRPNVVILLADDMGYGEVQALNPERGKIKTPHLDAVARNGMIFTDGHSGSSVCTPTRYGLMTGRYAWRTRLQNGVLTGGKSLIGRQRLTIAGLMKQQGYHTAAVGKWHLGMLFDGKETAGKVPIGATVTDGPLDAGGFDEFHGFHHARQMDLWIDNDKVTRHITPVEMLPQLTETAVRYIEGRKGKKEPFFLYVPWNSPHSPVAPSPEWAGKSGLNAHADFVMQTDACVGQVIQALRDNDMLDNTLLICSSDNGTSANTAHIKKLQDLGHFPSADLRGSKADVWDGGHRVPFLVQWPAVVKPNSQSNAIVCLTDVMATVAEITGAKLPIDAAEDSVSFLPILNGSSTATRQTVIHHSVNGSFAIRQGAFKFIACPDSGGWSDPRPKAATWKRLQAAGKSPFQLYDLSNDLGEQHNLADDMPEKTTALLALLEEQVHLGRTTPGPKQANDVKVSVVKRATKAAGHKSRTKDAN